MHIFIYEPRSANAAEFIEFWRQQYDYALDKQYASLLTKPFTQESIEALFIWKNGGKLSERKLASVQANYVAKLEVLNALPPGTDVQEFLDFFGGGMVWRIFLLHCWNSKYPIYDQHVHRAMTYLQSGHASEIPSEGSGVREAYLTRYIPFVSAFAAFDPRETDRALWAFGKYLKRPRFPLLSVS